MSLRGTGCLIKIKLATNMDKLMLQWRMITSFDWILDYGYSYNAYLVHEFCTYELVACRVVLLVDGAAR